VVPALKKLAAGASDFRTRVQAFWTLSGMGALDGETVSKALSDSNPYMRLAGVRGAEPFLAKGDGAMQAAVLKLSDDTDWDVRRQLAASLGELPPEARVDQIVALLRKFGDDPMTVDAGISGLKGQEADALEKLVSQPDASADAVEMLAGAAAKSRDAAQMQKLVALATDAKQPETLRQAMLTGAITGLSGVNPRPAGTVKGGRAGGMENIVSRPRPVVKPLPLPAQPMALASLSRQSGEMGTAAKAVLDDLSWPGKPVPPAPKNTRTPEEEAMFKAGQGVYATNCAGCHQDNGQGAPHVAAALAGSRIVNGRPEMPLRVLLNGKEGSIGEMPPLGQSLSDEQLAQVLTYVRGSFGNTASPIHPPLVKEFRQLYAYRKKPWTDAELEKPAR